MRSRKLRKKIAEVENARLKNGGLEISGVEYDELECKKKFKIIDDYVLAPILTSYNFIFNRERARTCFSFKWPLCRF